MLNRERLKELAGFDATYLHHQPGLGFYGQRSRPRKPPSVPRLRRALSGSRSPTMSCAATRWPPPSHETGPTPQKAGRPARRRHPAQRASILTTLTMPPSGALTTAPRRIIPIYPRDGYPADGVAIALDQSQLRRIQYLGPPLV